jgi:hypothetical protein
MPHFSLHTNEDGSIRQILRDGQPYDTAIRLEPAYSIVSTYFKLAAGNLKPMPQDADGEMRRFHGLQAFLMSLTGAEAFTNIYFQLLAHERGNTELLAKVSERYGPLVPRLAACLELAFDSPLDDQGSLLQRIRDLYQLRNQIVHPRWDPASVTIGGTIPILIAGMSQNFQATFEDEAFCREAFLWCLLLIVRVARAAGNTSTESFCFFWTGVEGLTEEWLVSQLGLPHLR